MGEKRHVGPLRGKAPSADVTTSKAPSRVSSLPVRASARLKRGQQHAISFSWSQEDCGHARRGDLPCLDLSTFFSCSCWILTGVGCLMEEVKAPLAWA